MFFYYYYYLNCLSLNLRKLGMHVIRRTERIVQRPRIKQTKQCNHVQTLLLCSKFKVSKVCTKDKNLEGNWGNRNIIFHYIISCMNWFVILFEKSPGLKKWQPEDNCVKKNQIDVQLTLFIFRQPPHVSGVSRPFIRRYNRMYTKIGTYYSF